MGHDQGGRLAEKRDPAQLDERVYTQAARPSAEIEVDEISRQSIFQ
jgi:hypothetical protein